MSNSRSKLAILTAASLTLFCATTGPLTAQTTGIIRGEVRETGTQRPLGAVQVSIPGTTRIVRTDNTGRYTLAGVPTGQITVRAELVGYSAATRTVSVPAGQTVRADFGLSASAVALDEIVVTGTGAPTARRTLGHTIASVGSKALEAPTVSNVSQALQGREPGIEALPTGGMAGEGAKIRIRGSASLSQSNQPIIYVDGVRIDNGGTANASGLRASRLDDINPESIEKIEILKGAAAATLYGTEASNGVIQIFTKKGSSGKPRWEYRLDQGFSSYPSGRIQAHAGYARTQVEADRLSQFWGVPGLQAYQVFETDLMSRFFETGRHSAHTLSVNGGGEGITYYLSGRLTNENGPFGGKEWRVQEFDLAEDIDQAKQFNGNVILLPFQNFSVRVSGMYTERHHEEPGIGNSTVAPYSIALLSQPQRANERNSSGAAALITVREGMQRLTWQDVERFGGSIGANYEPMASLTVDATLGLDVVNQRTANYVPFGYNVDRFTAYDTLGRRSIADRNFRSVSLDSKANWREEFGNISSVLTVGGQALLGRTQTNGATGADFPAPGLQVASAGAIQTATDAFLETVNAGVFGQEQIGWKDFAFLTVGGRYDRHSAFGQNAGGAFYPKASLSVVPSDLAGWNTSLFSTLQLRAAVGRSGLQPGAFDRFTTFQPNRAETGPGIQPLNLGNPDLKPEVTTEAEAGVSLGLFENRVSLDATYWHRNTEDLLVARQFAPSGGFLATQLDNIGTMKSQGVEVGIKGALLESRNVSISPFFNIAYLHQKLTDLGGAPDIKIEYFRYLTWHRVGYSPGAYFGPKLMNTEIPISLAGNCTPATREQLLAYVSQPRTPQSLPVLAEACGTPEQNLQYLGKPTPDWSGAFGGDVTLFRNFTLTNQLEFKFGNYSVHNLGDAFRRSHALLGRNTRRASETEAILTNPASTPEQRYEAALVWAREFEAFAPNGINQVEKGDFLRWRESSLTFAAPASFAERVRVRSLSLSLGVRNLALWTGYSGIDPESNVLGISGNQFVEGVNAWAVPLPRRVTFSARLGF